MATPMVAGEAALIRSKNTGWNPEQVKADIMNTAGQDLYTGDNHTGLKYGPNRVGAGRIDAKAALDNQVLAYVTDDPGAVTRLVRSGRSDRSDDPDTRRSSSTTRAGRTRRTTPRTTRITTVPGATYSVSPSQVTVAAGIRRRRSRSR